MQFCGKEYPSKSLEHHEKNDCEERPTNCKYQRIGCQWKGPIHECEYKFTNSVNTNFLIFHLLCIASEHEGNCLHPKKTGAEVMLALQENDTQFNEERKLFSTLIELLSYEKIIFNGNRVYLICFKKWPIFESLHELNIFLQIYK